MPTAPIGYTSPRLFTNDTLRVLQASWHACDKMRWSRTGFCARCLCVSAHMIVWSDTWHALQACIWHVAMVADKLWCPLPQWEEATSVCQFRQNQVHSFGILDVRLCVCTCMHAWMHTYIYIDWVTDYESAYRRRKRRTRRKTGSGRLCFLFGSDRTSGHLWFYDSCDVFFGHIDGMYAC